MVDTGTTRASKGVLTKEINKTFSTWEQLRCKKVLKKRFSSKKKCVSWGATPRKRTLGKWVSAERGRPGFPQGWAPKWLFSSRKSALKTHRQAKLDRLSMLQVHIHVHMYMFIATINREKEVIHLKGAGKRKGRGNNNVIIFLLLRIANKLGWLVFW